MTLTIAIRRDYKKARRRGSTHAQAIVVLFHVTGLAREEIERVVAPVAY